MKKNKIVELEIKEAYTRDVGRGVARIDYDDMDKLDISIGNTVQIIGKKKAPVIIKPIYPSDEGRGIVRTDSLVRFNAGVEVGDKVKIKKIYAPQATKIFVAYSHDFEVDMGYLRDALEGVPLAKGITATVPYFGGKIEYLVTMTEPSEEAVVVTGITKFETAKPKGDTFTIYDESSINDLSASITKGQPTAYLIGGGFNLDVVVSVSIGGKKVDATKTMNISRDAMQSFDEIIDERIVLLKKQLKEIYESAGSFDAKYQDVITLITTDIP